MEGLVWTGVEDEDHCEWMSGDHVFRFVEVVFGFVSTRLDLVVGGLVLMVSVGGMTRLRLDICASIDGYSLYQPAGSS